MELLKLAALDAEDLGIISAHLQDAILKASDLAYLSGQHRFVLVARRFDWSVAEGAPPRRRLTGMHFDRVLRVRSRGLTPGQESGAPLELLAITFAPTEAPSGTATLVFAGGAAIQGGGGRGGGGEGRPDPEAAAAGRAAIAGHGAIEGGPTSEGHAR